VSYTAQAEAISTRPGALRGHLSEQLRRSGDRVVDISSRRPIANANPVSWDHARQRMGMFASLPDSWDLGSAVAPSQHTLSFAAECLAVLSASGYPAPTVNPSPDGAIYAHWHRNGLEIELIFQGPYDVTALIDDDRGIVTPYDGDDSKLEMVSGALATVCSGR
jgi:hypothetical protein